MSQFNTATHHEAPQLRGVLPRWIGGIVLVLALGIGLGYLISNITAGEESAVAAISETMAFEEFVRLNTADLDSLVAETAAVEAVDPFTELNVNSYEGLIEGVLAPKAVAPAFWEINTSFEGLNEGVLATKALAPGFWDINTDLDYELVQAIEPEAAEVEGADAGFWKMNVTSYLNPYSEPASGPR